jgi:sugar-specific transcriptional regulator TrmB
MTNQALVDALNFYGFSDKETKVYLTTLELGSATAQAISERSTLNRSTVYDILRSLISKGIISNSEKNSTQYFEAAGPEKLLGILDEKRNKIQNVMKELKLVQEYVVNKPKVRVFTGKEGFNTVLEDILYTKKHTDVISTSKIFDIMRFDFPHYIINRAKYGITARVIQEDSQETKDLKKSDKKQLRETRSIKSWNINSMMFMYSNKTAIIKLVEGEIISILIEDKTLYEDNEKIFEVLWEKAK